MKGETQNVERLADPAAPDTLSSGITMRFAVTRFQLPVVGQRWVRLVRPEHEVDRLAGRFQRGSSSERCGNAGANPAATRSTLRRATARSAVPPVSAPLRATAPRGGYHETQVPCRISASPARSSWLRWAALPPFAQVIADMDGLSPIGSRRGGVCVHDGKPTMRISRLPLPLR